MSDAQRPRPRPWTDDDVTDPVARTRGRPHTPPTIVVSVRLPAEIYDGYCRCARRAKLPVRAVLRQILTFYAPRT